MKKILLMLLACAGCVCAFGSNVRYELLTCSKPDRIKVRRIESVMTEGSAETVGLGYHGQIGVGGTLQTSRSRSERITELELTLVEGLDLGIQEDNQAILDEVFRKIEKYPQIIDGTSAVDQTGKRVASTRVSRILGNIVCAFAGIVGAGIFANGLWHRDDGGVGTGGVTVLASGLFAWLLNLSCLNSYERYARTIRRVIRLRGCRLDHAYLTRAYDDLQTVLDARDFDRIQQISAPQGADLQAAAA